MATTKSGGCRGSSLALVVCAVLGTLACSVPITAFLMHYLTQERGSANTTGQVETASVEGKLDALRYEMKPRRGPPRGHQDTAKPAVHFIGRDPSFLSQERTLVWSHAHNMAFPQLEVKGQHFTLSIPQAGFYYVYCQVGFQGSCHNARSPLILSTRVCHKHNSYPTDCTVLLEVTETVCSYGNDTKKWYTSLSQGALVQLQRGHLLFVEVMHPELVDYEEGKTFFGAMLFS
ncbi:lymphotoxin-beta-like [Ambystoma mexicanum]|uniref:lymphotoxin-beta-like n=1 Tax=Ambystoma mexicanum TaxID=8296 RepID=UPI0037E8FAC4